MMYLRTIRIFCLFSFCMGHASQTPKTAKKYIHLKEAIVEAIYDSTGKEVSVLALLDEETRIYSIHTLDGVPYLFKISNEIKKKIVTDKINPANYRFIRYPDGRIVDFPPNLNQDSNSKNIKSPSSTT